MVEHLTIDWHFSDLDQRYRMSLSNGVLVHYPNLGLGAADLAFTLTKAQLLGMLAVATWRASSTRATPGRSSGC